jgi:hypothetical protein
MHCCQQLAVVNALAPVPFGMPAPVSWIYVSASLLFLVGLIKVSKELPHRHGVDNIMPFGRLMLRFRWQCSRPSISPSQSASRTSFPAGFLLICFGPTSSASPLPAPRTAATLRS